MLMALKYRGYSIRYRHSSLKVDNRRRSTVSRLDNRLSSKHIFRRHYFLQSFQRKILCYLISTDRIGTRQTCQSGLWREIGFSPTVTFFKGEWSKQLNLGKQMFCSISRVTGTDTTSPDKLRCNVAMNVATGDWTLTQNIGIGFNYCDAVCFK
ncbi:hypothetical protein RO688_004403 [Salmonella enterica]|nr:hypothetical protein [Salmonella enterica]